MANGHQLTSGFTDGCPVDNADVCGGHHTPFKLQLYLSPPGANNHNELAFVHHKGDNLFLLTEWCNKSKLGPSGVSTSCSSFHKTSFIKFNDWF